MSHSLQRRFGIVSFVLKHCLSSPKLNVSDNRQSVKSHQLSAGRKRFALSLEVVCSFTDVLVSTEKRNTVRTERKGLCGGETAGPGMKERRKKTSVLRFDDSEGGCHIAMNI